MNGGWVLGSSPIIPTIFEPRDISRCQGLADELVYTRYGARVRANSITFDVRTMSAVEQRTGRLLRPKAAFLTQRGHRSSRG
jgi:hypothetical protein